jgi:hypothetical protein
LAISHEQGLTEDVKGKFLSGLAVASDLVTLGGAAFPLLAPIFNHIDLGVVLMTTTAAFGLGGAVLGTIDVQIAESFMSNVFRPCSTAGG